jgi:type II secretory pathway component PulJ
MKNKGFTLIEIMLFVSIAAGFVLTLSAFLDLMYDNRIRNETANTVEMQGTQALLQISQAIRNQTTETFRIESGRLVKTGSGEDTELTSFAVVVTDFQIDTTTPVGGSDLTAISFTMEYNNENNRDEYDYSQEFSSIISARD